MGALALRLVSLFAASLTVEPGDGCPSQTAVMAELEHLGGLVTLEQMGSAEVKVRTPILQILLRDQQARFLGERQVTVTSDCAARANLAAAMIAAWTGAWSKTQLASSPPSPPASALPHQEPAPSVTTGFRRWAIAAGAYGHALHDGDRGAAGLGAAVEASSGSLLLTALFEGSTEREVPLGPGLAGYRFLRGGVGLGGRAEARRLFVDASFAPLLSRLTVDGKGLQTNNHVVSWGVSLLGRLRAGWTATSLTPYLFFELSRDLLHQEATLDDLPQRVNLSPTNAAVGLGLSFPLRRP